jgi:chaperonin GroEL (HSP60 family)
MIGGHHWVLIKSQKNTGIGTILIRGFADAIVDEIENSINNSFRVIKEFTLSPRVLIGGGATEIEMANSLRMYARKIIGRKQIAINEIAEAIETVPIMLANSCGLDPFDSIAKLRMLHKKGRKFMGIDVRKRKIANMLTAGVYIPFRVYEQVIKSTFETSIRLLRINDFISSRTAQGREYWKKRVEEFTEPKREKQLIKEYGIDR